VRAASRLPGAGGGGLPGTLAGKPAHKDIGLARSQVRDGVGELLEYAQSAKMRLAIEPLHPMYAADRACINILEQALDVCDELDPCLAAEAVRTEVADLGVAVDVYHVWWDPKLKAQIERAGRRRLLAFHVCDWLTRTTDLLNDRGMRRWGDGTPQNPQLGGGTGVQRLQRSRDFLEQQLVAARPR
jgi:sugar phosphate isomerase/epimerase